MSLKTYGTGGYQSNFDGFADYGYPNPNSRKGKSYAPCYESHPKILIGGGTLYGGSCSSPVIKTADVYVGLDYGMRVQPYSPWDKTVAQFLYEIKDMHAPSDPKSFAKLVEYVCNQLQQGKVVHAGCIGGHGRTGTLFAALFSVINGDKDATNTVRKLYCKKAVESTEQIEFLHKYFGITKVEGTKQYTKNLGYFPASKSTSTWPKAGASEVKKSTVFSSAKKVWNCVNSSTKLVGALF